MSYYDFMNTYGGYSSSIGLDTTKPLGEQQWRLFPGHLGAVLCGRGSAGLGAVPGAED